MNRIVKDQLWIVLAAAVVYFTNLGATGLWDLDEPLYASCAREMLDRGDWVVPRYNGEIFDEKPVLMFWLQISGILMFGASEFAVRFWSPILGIIAALATYHLGRFLFRREVGFWAGLITATTIGFTVSARAATADTALALASLIALGAFVLAERQYFCTETGPHGKPSRLVRGSLIALMWAMMGLATLAKGPIGLLLPAATIGLFLLIMNRTPMAKRTAAASWGAQIRGGLAQAAYVFSPRNFLRAIWQMGPLAALIFVLAVAAPWYILVGQRTDGSWLKGFFLEHNFNPFLKPSMGHRGPFYYQFVAILIFFFPWSVFLGPAMMAWVRRIRQGHALTPAYIFLACWTGVWFVFWSTCSTKLPHNVLPAYPALAIVVAAFLSDWLAAPAEARRWWWRNAMATMVLVGVGIAIVVPILTRRFAPGEEMAALVGLPLIVGGLVGWHYQRHGRTDRMLGAFTLTSVVFLMGIFGFAAVLIDRHQHSKPLVAEVRRQCDAPQFAGFRYLAGFSQASTVYYAGGTMPALESPDAVREFLQHSSHPYVFVLSSDVEKLERALPGELEEVARRPRFLKKGDVIVLTGRQKQELPREAAVPRQVPIQ